MIKYTILFLLILILVACSNEDNVTETPTMEPTTTPVPTIVLTPEPTPTPEPPRLPREQMTDLMAQQIFSEHKENLVLLRDIYLSIENLRHSDGLNHSDEITYVDTFGNQHVMNASLTNMFIEFQNDINLSTGFRLNFGVGRYRDLRTVNIHFNAGRAIAKISFRYFPDGFFDISVAWPNSVPDEYYITTIDLGDGWFGYYLRTVEY